MIKFIVTSPSYIGEVHIVYGDDCCLKQIDFLPAELTDKQVEFLKYYTPIIYDKATFLQCYGDAKLEFTLSDYEITFDMFWDKYDRKINRPRSLKVWGKLNRVDRIKAYFGIIPYLNHLAANPWKNQADPETYLKNKYWENQWK